MAKDSERKSEAVGRDEPEDEEEMMEAVEITDPDRPACPKCGWHNTRLSHTTNALDRVLRAFSLRAFRCRTCGIRFRAVRRAPRVE